jgi:hypothetical protein
MEGGGLRIKITWVAAEGSVMTRLGSAFPLKRYGDTASTFLL